MEVIPRTLAQNCGANVIRTLTKLRAKHAEAAAAAEGGSSGSEGCRWGINGETGGRMVGRLAGEGFYVGRTS
jgi:T-complex protein 1 subunit gamma